VRPLVYGSVAIHHHPMDAACVWRSLRLCAHQLRKPHDGQEQTHPRAARCSAQRAFPPGKLLYCPDDSRPRFYIPPNLAPMGDRRALF